MNIKGPATGEKFVFVLKTSDETYEVINHWSELKNWQQHLKISSKSISIFLRNGLIFPPYTIYSNVIMVPIGAEVEIDPKDGAVKWKNEFRFLDKHSKGDSAPSQDDLLSKITGAFEHLTFADEKVYVMQSAGKDSAAMLLGLKSAGVDNVKCLTYEASFRDEEGAVAKEIAESLGFEHEIIGPDYEYEYEQLKSYQKQCFGITGDFALLPYIAANSRFIEKGSVVIDGLGNDLYMGYVSPRLERIFMALSGVLPESLEVETKFSDERISYVLSSLFLAPYERLFPGSRMTKREIQNLTGTEYIDEHKEYFHKLYKTLDKDDFRVAVRARRCDSSQFQMKAELACDVFGNSAYFPFSNKELVDYYFNLPLGERYDKEGRENKTLMRKLINAKIDNDKFFKIKSGFRYNIPQFIKTNFSSIKQDIIECRVFDADFASTWLAKLEPKLDNYVYASRVYIALILATWINEHDFIIDESHWADQFNWYDEH